ncbi:MAG: hypothetical protein K0Q55_1414 [Verrucomicrobia bacterium]|jgi:hypothetical protein|nr:hypothetical protein [Verrucomicrobiota bacterium]
MKLALILVAAIVFWQGCVCPPGNPPRTKVPLQRITSAFEKPMEDVRRAVRQGIEEKGDVTHEDTGTGLVKGTIGTSTVSVKISQVTEMIVQTEVVVRDQAGVFEYEKSSELDRAIVLMLR